MFDNKTITISGINSFRYNNTESTGCDVNECNRNTIYEIYEKFFSECEKILSPQLKKVRSIPEYNGAEDTSDEIFNKHFREVYQFKFGNSFKYITCEAYYTNNYQMIYFIIGLSDTNLDSSNSGGHYVKQSSLSFRNSIIINNSTETIDGDLISYGTASYNLTFSFIKFVNDYLTILSLNANNVQSLPSSNNIPLILLSFNDKKYIGIVDNVAINGGTYSLKLYSEDGNTLYTMNYILKNNISGLSNSKYIVTAPVYLMNSSYDILVDQEIPGMLQVASSTINTTYLIDSEEYFALTDTLLIKA